MKYCSLKAEETIYKRKNSFSTTKQIIKQQNKFPDFCGSLMRDSYQYVIYLFTFNIVMTESFQKKSEIVLK